MALANQFALPVRVRYMTGPPAPRVGTDTVTLFSVRFAWAVAAFFGLSALAHLLVVGPAWRSYRRLVSQGRNPYRWLEYSLSASIMIVLIAMLVGIDDVAALTALVGVNASMIGSGWMQERYEIPGACMQPFWIGCVAGHPMDRHRSLPHWPRAPTSNPPGFVRHLPQPLRPFQRLRRHPMAAVPEGGEMEGVPRRRTGLRGPSLIAKSLLAWQIFASTLASR